MLAYFFVVSTSYGVEFFLPGILEKWVRAAPESARLRLFVAPPLGGLAGQLLVGWSSDRTGERRLHGSMPIYMGAGATTGRVVDPASLSFNARLFCGRGTVHRGRLSSGLKSYMPAFWGQRLPPERGGRCGRIGLINSLGNLGGFVGPSVLGKLETRTHSFVPGLMYLCGSMVISATIILTLGLGHRIAKPQVPPRPRPLFDEETDSIVEPV